MKRQSHRPPNVFLQREIDEHNAKVEQRKREKLERKVARLMAGRQRPR